MRKILFTLLIIPFYCNAQLYEFNSSLISYNNKLINKKSFSYNDYNPIVWLETKDTATLDKDINGYINTWHDKSNYNHNATQFIGANQPINENNNGIRFDGINDYLTVDYGGNIIDPLTVFIVYKQTPTLFLNTIIDGKSELHYLYWIILGADTVLSIGDGISNDNRFKTHFNSNYVCLTTEYNGANSKLYINNNEVIRYIGTNLNIGTTTGLTIGSLSNNTYPLKGYIKAILVFNKILTNDEKQVITNQLNTDYNYE